MSPQLYRGYEEDCYKHSHIHIFVVVGWEWEAADQLAIVTLMHTTMEVERLHFLLNILFFYFTTPHFLLLKITVICHIHIAVSTEGMPCTVWLHYLFINNCVFPFSFYSILPTCVYMLSTLVYTCWVHS